jgi:competence protein ComEA
MKSGISRALASAAGAALLAATALAADGSEAVVHKININQASSAQLTLLPRVGAKAADRIVDYRKAHGQFGRVEELMEVKGIGEKLFLQLKPYVTVSGPTTLSAKVSSRGTRGGSVGKKTASNSVPAGKGR